MVPLLPRRAHRKVGATIFFRKIEPGKARVLSPQLQNVERGTMDRQQ
jgi:hypothetical protein